MNQFEIVPRFDVALMQRIESGSKSREPQRSDGGKTACAALIDGITRPP